MEEIGIFPLGIVLLPTERVPLHIFEPRYRELIEECLEDDGEFGLVYADEEGVREIGTLARVSAVHPTSGFRPCVDRSSGSKGRSTRPATRPCYRVSSRSRASTPVTHSGTRI